MKRRGKGRWYSKKKKGQSRERKRRLERKEGSIMKKPNLRMKVKVQYRLHLKKYQLLLFKLKKIKRNLNRGMIWFKNLRAWIY